MLCGWRRLLDRGGMRHTALRISQRALSGAVQAPLRRRGSSSGQRLAFWIFVKQTRCFAATVVRYSRGGGAGVV